MKFLFAFLLACSTLCEVHAQQFCNASLSLDGIDDYGSISQSFFPNAAQRTFTIEFYVKSLGNTDPIPGIWGQYGNASYIAIFNISGIRFLYLNNGQTFSSDSTINTIGEWEHIAITGNEQSGTMSMFKNGVKIGERVHGTPDWAFIDNSSRIGAILDVIGLQDTYYYHGLIDDFHVSDSVLYTQNFTPPTQITANSRTRVLYDFNAVNGSVIQDFSQNDNDLTLHNGAQLSQDVPHPGGTGIITQEPVNQYPDFDAQATFSLTTGGQVTSQWYVNMGGGFQLLSDNAEYEGTQTTQLTIKQAKSQYNSYWYRCIVQRGLCSDTSSQVRVFVCGKITQHPSNVNAISLDTGSFTLTHSDPNAVFQWQYSNGASFVQLVPGTNYSGVNKKTLLIDKRGLGKGPHIYRCIVQSGVCTDTSRTALLFVCGTIVNQPDNVQGLPNIPCTFRINHSDPQATFQWIVRRKQNYEILNDGNGITGSKTSSISIDSARYSMNRWAFRCIVTSGICTDTSAEGILFLCGSIIGQPNAPAIARPGTTIQLNITHNDVDARFQWQKYDANVWVNMKDGSNVLGSKSAALFLSDITTKDHQSRYRCITNSVICIDTSREVSLTICGNITEQPRALSMRTGGSGTMSLQHSDINAQYQWQSSQGSEFSNLTDGMGVTGGKTDMLTFTNMPLSAHNRRYRCIIKTGGCIDTTDEVSLTVCGTLLSSPKDQTIKEGEKTLFAIRNEDPDATFQWQILSGNAFMNLLDNQQFIGVRNDTLFILNTSRADSGSVFRCLANSHGCMDTSKIATLRVNADQLNSVSEEHISRCSIYPNPVSDKLQIIGIIDDKEYRIMNVLGKEILRGIVPIDGMIEVSILPRGFYILHIGLNHPQAVTFMKN